MLSNGRASPFLQERFRHIATTLVSMCRQMADPGLTCYRSLPHDALRKPVCGPEVVQATAVDGESRQQRGLESLSGVLVTGHVKQGGAAVVESGQKCTACKYSVLFQRRSPTLGLEARHGSLRYSSLPTFCCESSLRSVELVDPFLSSPHNPSKGNFGNG